MNGDHNPPIVKRTSTIFLQTVIVLVGIGVLAALLWEPHVEGRNIHATLFQMYFQDPFLAYVYAASIPFFVALYQGFKVLGYAGRNRTFSQATVKSLGTIKHCAFLTAAAIVAADVWIKVAHGKNDDPAGALMMGFIAIFVSMVIGTAAAVLERVLQNAVELKHENDLTV